MKIISIIFLISIAAQAQDICSEKVDALCEVPSFDIYEGFSIVKERAFEAVMEDRDFKEMVCQNFEKLSDGTVRANFSWKRDCSSSWVKVLAGLYSVKSCSDFFKLDASPHFVDSCESLVAAKMASFVSSTYEERFEEVLVEVKNDYTRILQDIGASDKAKHFLDSILPKLIKSAKLGQTQQRFYSASEICEEYPHESLCELYKESKKIVLVPGGSIFLNQNSLRALMAQRIAEVLSKLIHEQLLTERMSVFFSLYSSRLNFESIIARAGIPGNINLELNSAILLSKYYELNSKLLSLNQEISFLCQNKKNTVIGPDFGYLGIEDQMKVVTCQLANR